MNDVKYVERSQVCVRVLCVCVCCVFSAVTKHEPVMQVYKVLADCELQEDATWGIVRTTYRDWPSTLEDYSYSESKCTTCTAFLQENLHGVFSLLKSTIEIQNISLILCCTTTFHCNYPLCILSAVTTVWFMFVL